jgi:SsrA-binding protein
METKFVNRKAYYEYEVLTSYEAGVVLTGSEVKSIRDGKINMTEAFCMIIDGEMFMKNLHITKYKESSYNNHEETRDRKLLLHKKEIKKIEKALGVVGTTIIPLEMYPVRGIFKFKIAVARGKKLWNKKQATKERDIKREVDRGN